MTNKKISITTTTTTNASKANLMSKCNSCSHQEVCKYKEEFEKFIREIKNKNIKIPKMFDLDIKCSKYSSHCTIRTIDPTPQIMPLTTPGMVPAPNYIPGIAPSITTPNFDDVNFPKITCELTDASIGTATITTDGINGKGTINLRG